jgi:hypothetical protein
MSDFVKYSLTPALAYILVAHPKTYELTRGIAGSWVATQDGVAKTGGLVLHAIVFVILVSLLMRLFGGVSRYSVSYMNHDKMM